MVTRTQGARISNGHARDSATAQRLRDNEFRRASNEGTRFWPIGV
jgi:hypothetical protein